MEPVLDRNTANRISYVNFIIIGFARYFKLFIPDAFAYLDKYGGLDFLYDHYEYEHTQPKYNTCIRLYKVCRKNGGQW
jgi:hypothetical protein